MVKGQRVLGDAGTTYGMCRDCEHATGDAGGVSGTGSQGKALRVDGAQGVTALEGERHERAKAPEGLEVVRVMIVPA